jgi:hypothetical protein
MLVLLMGVIFKHTVEMSSDGLIYLLSFQKIGSGVQVILRLLPEQSRQLQYW